MFLCSLVFINKPADCYVVHGLKKFIIVETEMPKNVKPLYIQSTDTNKLELTRAVIRYFPQIFRLDTS